MLLTTDHEKCETGVAIGGLPITICCQHSHFIRMLEERYANFLCCLSAGSARLDVTVIPPGPISDDEDLIVREIEGRWAMRRGDFLAQWNPIARRGTVRLSHDNPYGFDSVLRIIHSFAVTEASGFLLHAASVIRHDRAFVFTGISGAGKTTIARLAPVDVTLLTDEVSYIRQLGTQYHAFGTPFAGELGIPGKNVRAPLSAVYFLAKGPQNHIRPLPAPLATAKLLRNILFFADSGELVKRVFDIACQFVTHVPVYELIFRPDTTVWELIR